MNIANISWFILDAEEYTQESDVYIGSYSHNETISIKCQLWNNRYGTTHIESVENATLGILFESIEDSYMLNYCSVTIDNGEEIKPTIEIDRGLIEIGLISGDSNNGEDSISNKNNYYDIEIKFKNVPSNIKKGLKSLYVDIYNI